MTTADLSFSLVVNTLDRALPLQTLLRTLEHQSYPHFEVVVVVGPTHDNTFQILSEYSMRLRVLRCPTANLSESRNIGLLGARGDIVAFIDDDAVPCQRWLEQLAHLFHNPTLDATGGVVYTIHPNHSTIQHRAGIASALAEQTDVRQTNLDSLIPHGRSRFWLTRMMGTNMAVRRQALLDARGFDMFFKYIAEETDLVFRMALDGKQICPVFQAPVYHIPASSRNRTVFTHKGNWWLRSRSRVYFGIKNGLASGDAYGAIAVRSFFSVAAHWLWYWHLWRGKHTSLWDMLAMDTREVWGGLEGTVRGLFMARQLIKPATIDSASASQMNFVQFQNDQSARQAAVDPVSGERPRISLPDPPLRICLLSNHYPPHEFDGIGRHTHLMARGLFDRGHTVHVVARGDRHQVSFFDGAFVHRIVPREERFARYRDFPNLYHLLNYSYTVHDQVKRLVLNDGIQIVDSPLWQFEGLVTAMSGMMPVAMRLQTSMRQINALVRSTSEDMRLIGELEQSFAAQASHWIPNSQATLDVASRNFGLRETNHATIIPHGIVPVPEDVIRPFDVNHAHAQLTVLFVGRLEKRKGILDLFQAIPRVLERVPHARFIVAGSDNSRHDGFQLKTGMDYRAYFERHYAPVIERVQFTGTVSDEELQQLYAGCDLFVAPSLYESFGLIYLEAMNYAKPVIGCRAGGIPEVIDDGVTGVLVDPESPRQLAEAISDLLVSPMRLRELGLAARERLLRDFTCVKMAERFEFVYRRLLHANSTR